MEAQWGHSHLRYELWNKWEKGEKSKSELNLHKFLGMSHLTLILSVNNISEVSDNHVFHCESRFIISLGWLLDKCQWYLSMFGDFALLAKPRIQCGGSFPETEFYIDPRSVTLKIDHRSMIVLLSYLECPLVPGDLIMDQFCIGKGPQVKCSPWAARGPPCFTRKEKRLCSPWHGCGPLHTGKV